MSEGIVLDGNTPSGVNGARYGSNVPALALGEVSISDCKFLGQQTDMHPFNIPVRGWIFATPDYGASPVSINNCQFIGDRFGQLNTGTMQRPINHSDQQPGAAIHHASISELLVKGCLIHSLHYGVIAPATTAAIETTDFFEVGFGLVCGNDSSQELWDYAALDPAWALADESNISVLSCNFFGAGWFGNPASTMTGVIFFRNDDFIFSKNVSVNGCTFRHIWRAFDLSDVSAYAQAIPAPTNNYNFLEIRGNTFDEIFDEIIVGGSGLTNANTETARYWAVDHLVYSNNKHNRCGASLNALDVALVNATAEIVVVDDNSFIECQLSGGTAANPNRIFHFEGGFNVGTITNNKFLDCYNTSGTVNTIEISIASTAPKIVLNENVILTTDHSVTAAVQNGVLFNKYVTTLDTAPMLYNPILQLNNNEFLPRNSNFVVLAWQDVDLGGGDSHYRQWAWESAHVSNNYLQVNVTNNANFSDYSNWAQYNNPQTIPTVRQNYLGASKGTGGILGVTQFAAVLDLRRFVDSTYNNINANCAHITNNTLHLGDTSWNDPINDMDCHSLIGIRISSWPQTINIEGNTLFNAPICCKWTFNTPRDSGIAPIGYTIKITNNSYQALGLQTHYAVEVLPATGFAGKAALLGSDPEDTDNYVYVMVNNNIIKGYSTALDSTYNNLYSVVRLWPLTSFAVLSDDDAAGAPGQIDRPDWYDEFTDSAGVPVAPAGPTHQLSATSELCYGWQLQDNKLVNSVFYLDSESNGDTLALMAVLPAAPLANTTLMTNAISADITIVVLDTDNWPLIGTVSLPGVPLTLSYNGIAPLPGPFDPAGYTVSLTAPTATVGTFVLGGSAVINTTSVKQMNNYGIIVVENNNKICSASPTLNPASMLGISTSQGAARDNIGPLGFVNIIVQNNAGVIGANFAHVSYSGSELHQ